MSEYLIQAPFSSPQKTDLRRNNGGESRQGGQKTRYKDSLKASLKSSDIDFETWETLALDRPAWRSKINKEAVIFDQNRMAEAQNRCELRKSKVISSPPAQFTSVRECNRKFRSRINRISRSRTHCTKSFSSWCCWSSSTTTDEQHSRRFTFLLKWNVLQSKQISKYKELTIKREATAISIRLLG